jgi:hypothetical protein
VAAAALVDELQHAQEVFLEQDRARQHLARLEAEARSHRASNVGWRGGRPSSAGSYAFLTLAVFRDRAAKPAIDPKVLGMRISLTSWPALNREKSSWFRVSSAKMVTRSASTRSRILSLMSTRMSWMLPAELITLAISMSFLR